MTHDVLKTWTRAALNFIYPEICQVCKEERAGPDEGFVCGPCHSTVKHIEPPFCDRCGLPYEGAITSSLSGLANSFSTLSPQAA